MSRDTPGKTVLTCHVMSTNATTRDTVIREPASATAVLQEQLVILLSVLLLAMGGVNALKDHVFVTADTLAPLAQLSLVQMIAPSKENV